MEGMIDRLRGVQLPFALLAIVAFPLAWFPPNPPRAVPLAIAAVLTGVVGALVVTVDWDDAPHWLHPVPALLYLGVVGALRDAEGGSESGYAPLVLLPLLWIALHGRRRDLVILTAGVAVTLILPIVVMGEPRYPVSEWRRAALLLVIAPTLGYGVHALVGEIRVANRALEDASRTDALTGVGNRRAWDDALRSAVAHAAREGGGFSLALLDLDHFKRFNDTHGHHAGDDLLAAAAASWRQQLREIDTIARWGGEEFAVLLWGASEDEARATAERLRLATPDEATVSIGVATYAPGADPDEVLERTDAALYDAKRAGRDRVVVAS